MDQIYRFCLRAIGLEDIAASCNRTIPVTDRALEKRRGGEEKIEPGAVGGRSIDRINSE
jgi:hypothetical protein